MRVIQLCCSAKEDSNCKQNRRPTEPARPCASPPNRTFETSMTADDSRSQPPLASAPKKPWFTAGCADPPHPLVGASVPQDNSLAHHLSSDDEKGVVRVAHAHPWATLSHCRMHLLARAHALKPCSNLAHPCAVCHSDAAYLRGQGGQTTVARSAAGQVPGCWRAGEGPGLAKTPVPANA